MKLFKKRENAVTGSSSPSGSIEKASSFISQQNPAPTSQPQFPWSSKKISNNNPFPRYGHASNMQAGKDGDIFVFGGLVKDRAMHDLWIINSHELESRMVMTTGEGPNARVGHAALLIGNAFIIFGGDTKLNGDETNPNNDDNLYLLNTSTTTWTTAKVLGAKPSGRYGHTLNMLGPKVLVFGGQVEGFFFNDLVAFDLNTLNHANPRWELIGPIDGNEPPPSRTNHIAVTHADKLYVFGGTNGVDWFNDMWRFDPIARIWTMLKCSGFVPQPREGHSASIVGDVIYVFGGRDVDGNDLGDLSAFKITTSRWFTFQNMGPGPSPRSGHALCTVGKRIFVVGGEGASSKGDEQVAYILDTTKIRYPADRPPGHRVEGSGDKQGENSPLSRHAEPVAMNKGSSIRSVSGQSTTSVSRLPQSNAPRQPRDAAPRYLANPQAARRASGQPLDSPMSQTTSIKSPQMRESQLKKPGSNTTRNVSQPIPVANAPSTGNLPRSGSLDSMMDINEFARSDNDTRSNGASRMSRAKSLEEMKEQAITPKIDNIVTKGPRQLVTPLAMYEERPATAAVNKASNLAPPSRQLDNTQISPMSRPRIAGGRENIISSDSVVYSSDVAVKIAWLTAQLDQAKSAGYVVNEGPALEEIPQHDSMPALLNLHSRLQELQGHIDSTREDAEARVQLAVAERDVALRETAYEKAKNQALLSNDPELLNLVESQRNYELESRLTETASHHVELQNELGALQARFSVAQEQLSTHKALLESQSQDTAIARQQHSVILLKHNETQSELLEARRDAQHHQSRHIELETQLVNRQVDQARLKDLETRHTAGVTALEAAHTSISSALTRAEAAEAQVAIEQSRTADLQAQLSQSQSQVEVFNRQIAEHVQDKGRLQEQLGTAQEQARNANATMTGGLHELVQHSRSVGPHDPKTYETTIAAVQQELEATRALHSQAQQLLNHHVDQVSNNQALIRDLEAKHLSTGQATQAIQQRLVGSQSALASMRLEHSSLQEEHNRVKEHLEQAKVRYSVLEQLVQARPQRSDSVDRRRSRNITSPGSNGRNSQTPDAGRLKELEQKLVESANLQRDMQASHEQAIQEIEALTIRHRDSRQRQELAERRARLLEDELSGRDSQNESRELGTNGYSASSKELQAQARATEAEKQLSESTANFKERLGQLESDYQSAVHYVKGTEKMLRRMKEELGKYKSSNAKLQHQVENLSADREMPSDNRVRELETQLSKLTEERRAESRGADAVMTSSRDLEAQLLNARQMAEQLELEKQDMERRMNESDAKVKLLLDQFESSVDNYRRQSQVMPNSPDADRHLLRSPGSPDDSPLPMPLSIGTHRTSSALDLLASELDQLRNRWEATHQPSRYSINKGVSESGSGDPEQASSGLVVGSPLGRPIASRNNSSHADTAIDTLRNKRSRGLKSPRSDD